MHSDPNFFNNLSDVSLYIKDLLKLDCPKHKEKLRTSAKKIVNAPRRTGINLSLIKPGAHEIKFFQEELNKSKSELAIKIEVKEDEKGKLEIQGYLGVKPRLVQNTKVIDTFDKFIDFYQKGDKAFKDKAYSFLDDFASTVVKSELPDIFKLKVLVGLEKLDSFSYSKKEKLNQEFLRFSDSIPILFDDSWKVDSQVLADNNYEYKQLVTKYFDKLPYLQKVQLLQNKLISQLESLKSQSKQINNLGNLTLISNNYGKLIDDLNLVGKDLFESLKTSTQKDFVDIFEILLTYNESYSFERRSNPKVENLDDKDPIFNEPIEPSEIVITLPECDKLSLAEKLLQSSFLNDFHKSKVTSTVVNCLTPDFKEDILEAMFDIYNKDDYRLDFIKNNNLKKTLAEKILFRLQVPKNLESFLDQGLDSINHQLRFIFEEVKDFETLKSIFDDLVLQIDNSIEPEVKETDFYFYPEFRDKFLNMVSKDNLLK
ncbi:MAG: hypothetical protein HRT47_06120 [Candidatus Caenarcaniphilales bacterium]|nr:hypothetical protein [Candidatus Caenarcaniphilales bacterium]